MANTSLALSSLDFDTLKQNLKAYLSNQSVFRDYDFEGSNINVLLDILSYNSYLNSFYMNMVASEMFLDSSQKYDSVISHAKELNYLPISAASSYANLNITFETTGLDGSMIIPRGTRFSGLNENGSYEFVTRANTSITSSNNTFTIENLQIFEGSYFNDSFVYDTTQENLLLKLSNENVDLSSLIVNVIENNGANTYTFRRAENLFGLTSNLNIYFAQGSENNRYEIVFGDNILGRKPQHLAIITAEYVVCNGNESDGVSSFGLVDDLGIENNGSVSVSSITTVSNSDNGSLQENINSIKFNAPRHFAAQYRALADDDYRALILSEFGGRISDVIVYGGQDLEPKQYGRVAMSLKTPNSTFVPENLKNEIINYLLDLIAIPNRVVITSADNFYCHIITDVQYNTTIGNQTVSELKSNILTNINQFSDDHLEKFGNDFRYSKFVTHIDEVNEYITSNDTQVRLLKEITPTLNEQVNITINFNNELQARRTLCTGVIHNSVVLTTSYFTYVDDDGTQTEFAQIRDTGNGNLEIYKTVNNQFVTIKDSIGSINYNTGLVQINNLKVSSYENNISVLVNTKNKDIIATRNMILNIEPSYTTINVLETLR